MHDAIEFFLRYCLLLCAVLAVLAYWFRSLLLTILTLTAVAYYFREQLGQLIGS